MSPTGTVSNRTDRRPPQGLDFHPSPCQLLEPLDIQRLIGDDPLQPRVLGLQLLQALHVLGLHPAELVAPPKVRLLGDLQLLDHLRQLHPLAEQPVGLPQLANDLLRRMPASRHAIAPSTHSPGSTKLSQRPDRSQGGPARCPPSATRCSHPRAIALYPHLTPLPPARRTACTRPHCRPLGHFPWTLHLRYA